MFVILGVSHIGHSEHALVVGGRRQVWIHPDKKYYRNINRNIKYSLELLQCWSAGGGGSSKSSSKLRVVGGRRSQALLWRRRGGQGRYVLLEGDGAHDDGDPHHQVEPEPGWVNVELQAVLDVDDGAGAGQTCGRNRGDLQHHSLPVVAATRSSDRVVHSGSDLP